MNSPVRLRSVPGPKARVPALPQQDRGDDAIAVVLNAAILGVRASEPVVAFLPAAAAKSPGEGALPCGPYRPSEHGTPEGGLRASVWAELGVELGFLQQLCTLSNRGAGRAARSHVLSLCYLALVGPGQCIDRDGAAWHSWYAYFPWEDWRTGKPACLTNDIEPRLRAWAAHGESHCAVTRPLNRRQRLCIAFGCDGATWDEEKVLERYEVLVEAGLIGEAPECARVAAARLPWRTPRLSHPLAGDQARVLASAIGELRRSIKCCPAVFELMDEVFTLYELQKTVEAILGPHLHKQNFRRLVEGYGLVEPTGDVRLRTGGRPARLYRFRRSVLLERAAPGVRVRPGRV